VALATAMLAGCGAPQARPDIQTVVTARVAGMSVGDFFDTFGRPRSRSERGDGSTDYLWISETKALGSGAANVDLSRCTLRLVADSRNRIASVEVVLDSPGYTSTSRCNEIFAKK